MNPDGPWIQCIPSQLPSGLPAWVVADQNGCVYAFTESLQLAMAVRKTLTNALHRVLLGADTCPMLVRTGLTRASGEITMAGAVWIAEVPDTSPTLPN